jgi:hypothetical protein
MLLTATTWNLKHASSTSFLQPIKVFELHASDYGIQINRYIIKDLHPNFPLLKKKSRQDSIRSGPGFHTLEASRSHSVSHTILGRTSLSKGSVRRTDLYLTTHNTDDRHQYPRRDSKPQFQQTSGLRATP